MRHRPACAPLTWASAIASLACFGLACGGDDGSSRLVDARAPVVDADAKRATADAASDTRTVARDATVVDSTTDADASARTDGPADDKTDARVDAVVPVDAVGDAVPFVDAPYPAFAYEVPQVENRGGPVLTNALFVPVVFPGETLSQPIAVFMSAVGRSQYWASIGTEYGVGPATSVAPVSVTAAPGPNITDPGVQSFLAQAIASDPRFGALGPATDAGISASHPDAAPPANVVYVLFYPPGTTITATSLGTSCVDFAGYHGSFVLPNGNGVTYVVIPRCASLNGLSGIDEVTAIASHELIESATNPDQNDPAFVGTDIDHFAWAFVVGDGEVADMCSVLKDAYAHPAEADLSAFTVSRSWSNQAASAGSDPCVPHAPGEGAYFNAVPEATEVPFVADGQSYQTLGTRIAVGQTKTVEVDLASQGPTGGAWSVSLLDYGAAYGNPKVLDLTLTGATSGVNGDRLTLQITPLVSGRASQDGISPYFVYSTHGSVSTVWIGAVTN